ncbi:MAG: hypothetical protein NUV80_04610 [Candidatus Berkelbacteria bacterium]|nr:hypothetical protein [Candidatus Berkelbacteria bacterium]
MDLKHIMETNPTQFAKKEQVEVPSNLLAGMNILIPPIYYWEDVEGEKSVLMTMAFQMFGRNYGQSYSIDNTNVVKFDILKKKLFGVVKESLDVLIHHGEKVLDSFGNIDPTKVNDEEAVRYKYDRLWEKRVAAFNQLVRVAPITKARAKELGLLK